MKTDEFSAAFIAPPSQEDRVAAKKHVRGSDRIELAYVECGDTEAEPAMLVHGYSDNSRVYSQPPISTTSITTRWTCAATAIAPSRRAVTTPGGIDEAMLAPPRLEEAAMPECARRGIARGLQTLDWTRSALITAPTMIFWGD